MAFVPGDDAIVAWREVPGNIAILSRPVGYGLNLAGVRSDSMIGVKKLRMRNKVPDIRERL
jgi:hypothetical protein